MGTILRWCVTNARVWVRCMRCIMQRAFFHNWREIEQSRGSKILVLHVVRVRRRMVRPTQICGNFCESKRPERRIQRVTDKSRLAHWLGSTWLRANDSSWQHLTCACCVNGDHRNRQEKWRWKIIADGSGWLVIHMVLSVARSLRAVGRCLSREEDVRRANETLSPCCETFRRPPTVTKCQITRHSRAGAGAPPIIPRLSIFLS